VVPEATLKPADGGFLPDGEGWFVLNARDARWLEGDFGAYTRFEGEPSSRGWASTSAARARRAGVHVAR
jgi:hypothetical protein